MDDGIHYPIAIDGDYANWFIIEKDGYIRYRRLGEGDYTGSETTIQQLLAE